LDFSDKSIEEAKNALNGFYDLLVKRLAEREEKTTADKKLTGVIERCRVAFREAMEDDFNTPVAIAALQGMRNGVNKLLDEGLSTEARKIAKAEFRSLGNCLGLFQLDTWRFNPATVLPEGSMTRSRSKDHPAYRTQSYAPPLPVKDEDEKIQRMVDERNEARKQKDFKKADEIRQFLASHGIVVEDKPDGTSRWNR
jgi:cysteinyl-tRNA synthetase